MGRPGDRSFGFKGRYPFCFFVASCLRVRHMTPAAHEDAGAEAHGPSAGPLMIHNPWISFLMRYQACSRALRFSALASEASPARMNP